MTHRADMTGTLTESAEAAGHQQDARWNEAGEGDHGDPMPAVRLAAVDAWAGCLGASGACLADRGVEGGGADERVGEEQPGLDGLAVGRCGVEDEEVVGEVGHHDDDQGRRRRAGGRGGAATLNSSE